MAQPERRQPNRREFLKMMVAALGVAAAKELPEWIRNLEDRQLILDLVRACTFAMEEGEEDEALDGWQQDLTDCDDVETAVGLCFSFLLERGIEDPEEYLIEKGELLVTQRDDDEQIDS